MYPEARYIYQIGRPDWVLDAPVPSDHGVEATTAYPIQNKELLAEVGPGLIGGTVTVDDKSQTSRILVHSGINAWNPYPCVALLDSGSPQTSILECAWKSMV